MSDSVRSSISGRAVVLGGGLSGLLAAGALADACEVVIVERDDLRETTSTRRGVPQGRHVHALLARGGEAFDALLPGIGSELVEAGAATGDVLESTTWAPLGYQLRNVPSGLRAISASRALIEATVRRRVLALPRVKLCSGVAAVAPVISLDRVRGVHVRSMADGSSSAIEADLVVDAMGRSSPTPDWLNGLGFPRPPETRVPVQLRYVSRTYRARPDVMRGRLAIVHPPTPKRPCGAMAQRIEGGRVRVSCLGYPGFAPVSTVEGLSAHAARVGARDIQQIVDTGVPVDDIATYSIAVNVRRHYELLERCPPGLLVIGDALCGFNPAYAQGMTVAALEALALRELGELGQPDVAARFYRSIAAVVDRVWTGGLANDLQIPTVKGTRTIKLKVMNAWMHQFLAAARYDDELSVTFARVASLVDPPDRLLTWPVARRVLARRCGLRSAGPSTNAGSHDIKDGLLGGRP